MSSKVERALYGPSLSEVLIGAALSVVIGALIGLALLVTKPVLKVSEIPKDAPSGQIYFIDGAHLPARMADIDAKCRNLYDRGVLQNFLEVLFPLSQRRQARTADSGQAAAGGNKKRAKKRD